MTFNAFIKELKELESKATPGPWTIDRPFKEEYGPPDRVDGIFQELVDGVAGDRIVKTDSGCYPPYNDDAKFIAASRNALPILIQAVQSFRELTFSVVYQDRVKGYPTGPEWAKLVEKQLHALLKLEEMVK